MKKIGDLNKRITFQTYTTTENDLGDTIKSWIDFKTVWANVTNLYGREYYAAMQTQAEKTVKFTIRYLKDLDSKNNEYGLDTTKVFRIQFSNSNYDIKFIDNIKYNNEFMEIQAVAVI